MKLVQTIILLLALAAGSSFSEGDAIPTEKLVFKTEWKGERIELPPPFAPEMKLEGIEEIRFAPGMFDPKSDTFFSYIFVFSVPGKQKLNEEVIQRETLSYYRGLASSVLKGRGKVVDTSKFEFTLEKAEEAKETPASVDDKKTVTQYSGKLDWIEPFSTAEPQVLHFELQAWSDLKTGRNYLIVGTSPRETGDGVAVWKELRKIRSEFTVESAAAK